VHPLRCAYVLSQIRVPEFRELRFDLFEAALRLSLLMESIMTSSVSQVRISWGIHGLLKVSLGPAMPLFALLVATPETAVLLPPWILHAIRTWCICIWPLLDESQIKSQNKSQSKSQNKSQDKIQDKSQDKSQDKTLKAEKDRKKYSLAKSFIFF
jgi:hypothetical protein